MTRKDELRESPIKPRTRYRLALCRNLCYFLVIDPLIA